MTIDLALHLLRVALTAAAPALVLAAAITRAPKPKPARVAAAIRRPHPEYRD
jgi:hypothetical protein